MLIYITKCLCAISYDDGTALVMEYCRNLTLEDLINSLKDWGKPVPESLVMYFAFEILLVMSQIHQWGHCNIKPEIFFIVKIPTYEEICSTWTRTPCWRLVNFRLGIDLKFYGSGTTFYTVRKDPDFPQTGPWSFNIDYYGIASTLHCILFMQGIKVKTINGHHELVNTVKQNWQKDLWIPLFEMLLNVSADTEPLNVKPFLDLITENLKQQQHDLKFQLIHLSTVYEKQFIK